MKTLIVDINNSDSNGRIVVSGNDVNTPQFGETVRMLEIETGEYWYGTLEDVNRWSSVRSLFYIRPLHSSPLGGWIDYE